MAGHSAWRTRLWILVVAAAPTWLAFAARPALGVEAFDGRIQLHGFAEEQVRALGSQFQGEEFDLAQWYNVLNLEFEFDILPDGFGPIDLLSAYVRVEGRYDCIWKRGCGMFRSVNTYGDRAKRLPKRLRDARDQDYSGVIATGQPELMRIQDERPSAWVRYFDQPDFEFIGPDIPIATEEQCIAGTAPVDCLKIQTGESEGFPGFDTLAEQTGADFLLNTADDPFIYTMMPIIDYKWAFIQKKGFDGGAGKTRILGPWLPKNFIQSKGVLRDRANPFRTRLGTLSPYEFQIIPFFEDFPGIVGGRVVPDLDDPTHQRLTSLMLDDARAAMVPGRRRDPVSPLVQAFFDDPLNPPGTGVVFPDGDFFPIGSLGRMIVGGDISEITPCFIPGENDALSQIAGVSEAFNCFKEIAGFEDETPLNVRVINESSRRNRNRSDFPMRPGPDRSNRETSPNTDLLNAQGLYIPSMGLRREIMDHDFDHHQFNFRESERAWNRGASQQDNKELKEAYIDVEFLDSRLWGRFGLQNIVWGKTELFRTTDQFNPQDLALASLPSLEESRIALWSGRLVYSLYDVGPANDVRLEFAANFDDFEPADLGACGEPFTPDVVCGVTTGIAAHSFIGVGIAGVDRPPDPWKSFEGWEIGGRVEWRWDRFSFAVTDFYGFNDFPFPDAIFFYERNVDPFTGRPLIAESMGSCGEMSTPSGLDPVSNEIALRRMTIEGIGRDPECLKLGGAAGEANENRFDPTTRQFGVLAGSSPENALEYHHANQQVFAWICSASITIAASLDPSACAWSIFNSPNPLPAATQFNLVEGLSGLYAGETSANFLSFARAVVDSGLGSPVQTPPLGPGYPLVPLNRDPGDGRITALNSTMNGPTLPPLAGDPAPQTRDQRLLQQDQFDLLTADSTMTDEQRALIGCGPFWGTRCDSSLASRFRIRADCTIMANGSRNCPNPAIVAEIFYPEGVGGFDALNTEASALVQAWPGKEGTRRGWTTTSQTLGASLDCRMTGMCTTAEILIQPASLRWNPDPASPPMGVDPGDLLVDTTAPFERSQSFDGGPTCTRFVGGELVILPGCRGIQQIVAFTDGPDLLAGTPFADPDGEIHVVFDAGYDPNMDGCVIGGTEFGGRTVVAGFINAAGNFQNFATGSTEFVRARRCGNPAIPTGGAPDSGNRSTSRISNQVTGGGNVDLHIQGGRTLFHPLAACLTEAQVYGLGPGEVLTDIDSVDPNFAGTRCRFIPRAVDPGTGVPVVLDAMGRDFATQFLSGKAQIFQNEMAAFSFNFMMFLALASCDKDEDDVGDSTRPGDPECFNPVRPWQPNSCSYAAPHLCTNVQGFLNVSGVGRNTVKAAGNERFGRRSFLWHSGGELVLRYQKRNVFGFSMDFAEDVTKSNWGVEFTWIEGLPFFDNDDLESITKSDTLNLTVSVDRPTFINFLNANRTFFFNSQWFFQYITNYKDGFTGNGPFNVLFTFAVFTGYFQDRVLPTLISVYDFNSRSGGLLPSVAYRFTEAFSVSVGASAFWGHTQLKDMPVRSFGPNANRAGPNAYKDGVENFISTVRHRDEIWLRLRWTF